MHLRMPFFSWHCFYSVHGWQLHWTMGWPFGHPWVGCPGQNSTVKPIADGIPSVALMSSFTECVMLPFSFQLHQISIQDMADRMKEDGYWEAGYQSVHIDDCWMQWERDASGHLQANQSRFPSGIPALAEYVGPQVIFL